MKKILSYIKKLTQNRERVTLMIMALVFMCIYSVLGAWSPTQYNSPDEQANYFFIERFATQGEISYYEPLNHITPYIIHPRSTGVVGESIVPGSFLGLILFLGTMAIAFGLSAVPFVVPIVSALTPLFFFQIIARIFNRRIALMAALLLYIHPAFWYFSTRSLYPNMLMINLLIISAGLLFWGVNSLQNKKGRYAIIMAAGLFMGLAMSMRLNEAFWIAPLLTLALWWYRKDFKWSEIIFLGCSIFAGVAPFLYANYLAYGSPIFTGYFEVNNAIEQAETPVAQAWSLFKFGVLPFGFHIKNILINSRNYLLYVFMWWSLLMYATLVYTVTQYKKLPQAMRHYLQWYAILAIMLIVYYGSWKFHDHPDPHAISIGTSYIRYWLPLYILSLPIIAYAAEQLYMRLAQAKDIIDHKLLNTLFIGAFLTMLLGSFHLVWFKTDESFVNIQKNITIGQQVAEQVILATPEDAVVVTDYDDKFIFPHRAVIVPFRNQYIQQQIPLLLSEAIPVYYFGITLPQKDVDYLNTKRLFENGYVIEPVETFKNKTLYKFTLNNAL